MKYDEKDITRQLGDPKTRRAAFEAVVRQYSEPLYWKVRHIVVDHDDANDIMQNVFLKAWNSLDDFQQRSKISTWLYRIAVNESLDFLRKQKAASVIHADEDISVGNKLMADEYFDGDEVQALLQEAIAHLPDVQRTVFTLRYYDEMKYADMSQLLNTSEGALKASYHLAVKKITDYVRKHES
ncbi:MAG: sigma-70 family RNA polymerase sigma factor [Prevotella sp.]|nr:sigma-70 family RNA polymerase sigma factor [Prevotella sp.]